jgi:hypothetical protein
MDATTRSASTQVELEVTRGGHTDFKGERVITVKNPGEWGRSYHSAQSSYSAPPTPTGMNSYELAMPTVPHLALGEQMPGHVGMVPVTFQAHHMAQDLAVPAYHGFVHAPAAGYFVSQQVGYPSHQRALSAPGPSPQYEMAWGHPGHAFVPSRPFNP